MDVRDRRKKIVYVCHSVSAIMGDGMQNLIHVFCYEDETYLGSKVTLIFAI